VLFRQRRGLLFFKKFAPVNSAGKLHYDEQGANAQNCYHKAGVAFEEKAVREENQINQLRYRDFHKRKFQTDNEPHI